VSGPEHVVVDRLPAQPWKNGAGLTREVAVGPGGATLERFDWRISVARIDRDAPFSAFPGIDRCITLLRGGGVRLHSVDGEIRHALAAVGEPFHFPGETPLEATLAGGPCDDLNVMVRRGRWSAEVRVSGAEQRLEAADAGLVFALSGAWRCPAADEPIEPMQAWLWRTAMAATTVMPLVADSRALVVRLHALLQEAA
jgi:environmental stress-induced protein Ves